MRVWMVDEFGHGGIGRYAVDVADLLSAHDCTPIVATTGDGPVAGPPAASQTWFPRPTGGAAGKAVAAVVGMVRLLGRPARGDVVWVPLGVRPVYELGLVALRRLACGRVVVTVHNRKPHSRAGDSRAVRAACRLADEVIVHTRALEEWAVEQGLAPLRLPFPPPRLGPAPLGERPVGERARLVVSLLGYQYRYKGPDLLLRALARVRGDEVRVVLAGKPSPDVDLAALTAELGLGDRVTLRLGFLDEPELADLLDRTDVIALPYRDIDNTGIGAAAHERGLPAVASDLPALRELFGGAAVYVPAGDVDALARALAELPATYPGLAARAREAVTDRDVLTEPYRRLARRWASATGRRTGVS